MSALVRTWIMQLWMIQINSCHDPIIQSWSPPALLLSLIDPVQKNFGSNPGGGRVKDQMELKEISFKDLTKKIPGYYDGKPSPLGFIHPNGYHPDLVDGKKVSQRFNRIWTLSVLDRCLRLVDRWWKP